MLSITGLRQRPRVTRKSSLLLISHGNIFIAMRIIIEIYRSSTA